MEKKEQFVYVFDYSVGTITAFKTYDVETIEEQLFKRGYRESQCSWMVVEEEIGIEWL